ncbi:MAG: hypothetical protein ACE362_20005 [Phaeodactylibacter xiamenensis]|uniref:Uncharacterized protein n=1 Tax=Phaeodactylibacter xiamenensis TaxID=1524460 RepID=A0A098S3Z9_9BACT|nr:hypothetical protein [Phaeodactylibacter xiamenensis]KGE85902.1 hypothetical protein IX84_25175 [Phaeodactylibacter xiamenensis]MCR9051254.1 hypothetical protein [bacterium]
MGKPEKHIILRITNEGVFYNKEACIPWAHTNFPPKNTFNFNERSEIFWKARLLSFDAGRSLLKVAIVDYDTEGQRAAFARQKAKFPFRNLLFSPLQWETLEPLMNIYNKQLFQPILESPKTWRMTRSSDEDWVDFSEPEEQKTRIDLHFEYPLNKAVFKMGSVEVEHQVKELPEQTLTLPIENPNILPEFDHVKPFFAKALGKKKIEVHGYLEIDEADHIEIRCQSKEISQINDKFIATVRKLRLEDAIFKPKKITVEKSLFTPEEYFEGFDEAELGNTIRQSDKDLLTELLESEKIRNRKQLLYLSGQLQSQGTGLRFTLSPKFGFLFHVEGETMDHFIWELLNSHATYIWSIDRPGTSLQHKFRLIEREINFIRENGRRVYLDHARNEDLLFSKVNHENSESGLVDGFPKWRVRVGEVLV